MFKLADNQEIGIYLYDIILKNYKSVRQFCKAYIEEENRIASDDEIRKLCNRMSQIRNGKKGIQLADLPIMSKLLNVTCEQILSAGKSTAPTANHLNNYMVAYSRDPKVWEAYIKDENQLILNADEYEKTVIHYALEFENYDFMQYLLDNKYIWFVGTDSKEYFDGFGAGTSIVKNYKHKHNENCLNSVLTESQDLRMHMINLAIKHNNIKLLDDLHAREFPSLYGTCFWGQKCSAPESYFDSAAMEILSRSSNDILNYFSQEFTVTDPQSNKNVFTFIYLGELIQSQLKAKNKFAKYMLEDALEHNKNVYEKLKDLLSNALEEVSQSYFSDCDIKESIINTMKDYSQFCKDGNIVLFCERNTFRGFTSNIIKINYKSEDIEIARLIKDINSLYKKIKNYDIDF